MADTIKKKKDEYLIREGQESSEMYYVQSGTLGVFKRKSASEQQIGTVYSGELVGEMSFFDEEPRSASVKALSDCEVTVIPREKLDVALSKMPSWQKALVTTLVSRLRKANTKIRV